MDDKFTEAAETFAESSKRQFTAAELRAVQFRPHEVDTRSPVRLEGKVAVVKAGYALIDSKGLPRFLCPGSKISGIALTPKMEVSFEPAFAAKGAIADKLRVV